MLRMLAALAVLVAVLSLGAAAEASQQRVAVLQADDELLRAISLALTPWGLETLRSDAALPSSSQPDAVRGASLLARQLDVQAVVWMTSLDQGSLLWVFDVGTGDVTTRILTETPPLDGASAASVALSVKTVLRASVIAPPHERFGTLPPEAEQSPLSALEVGASALWLARRDVDFRARLSAILWHPNARRWGLSLSFSAGPGLRIEDAAYRGRYRELVGGGRARFRVLDLPAVAAIVGVGGALHWATLRGTLSAASLDSSVQRLNASLDLEATVNFPVTRGLYLGVSASGSYFPEYRRYLVAGEPVFSPWPFVANLTGHCGVELF